MPKTERIYKEITRCGKKLQELFTLEANTLYEAGNHFAQLHEEVRYMLNRLPLQSGLSKLNEIYITLNNMMIEWGNILRNQHNVLEKNFNTFFKYIRN